MSQFDFSFVTFSELPKLDEDEQLVVKLLDERGLTCTASAWDDQTVNRSAARHTIIRSAWDYHLHPYLFQQWLDHASSMTNIWNQPKIIRWNMHKNYLHVWRNKKYP